MQISTEYVIANVWRAEPSKAGRVREAAPPEISDRFSGRTYSLAELEQRGVRIASGRGYYTANGRDWELELAPVGR